MQMSLIVSDRMSKEDRKCRAAGMPFEKKKKRLLAILEAGEKEKERVAETHFTQPFNVQFPVEFPSDTSVK